MNHTILIPARSGSKRIPNKNIKSLGNIPLVAWSIMTGRELGIDTWVSTDSQEYVDIATKWGALTLLRPQSISDDNATDFYVISHFVNKLRLDGLVIYLRPTTPFRTAHVVHNAIRLMSVPGYDSLRSVEPMAETAYKCFRIKAGLLKPLTKTDYTDRPSQQLPVTYHPNGYVDIVRCEIVKSGSLWGRGPVACQTKRVVELDDLEQWEFAEWVAQTKGRRFSYARNEV